jgi:hypothetical protein
LVRYFASGQSFDPDILAWTGHDAKLQTQSERPAANLVAIISRFVDLHASVHRRELSDPETIVYRALVCEAELAQWSQQIPNSWKFWTVTEPGAEEDISQESDQNHTNVWLARVWMHHRWARILVHDIILTQLAILSPFPPEFVGQRSRSVSVTREMATNICDSVASQFLDQQSQMAIPDARVIARMSGIFSLLFPLAVAGGALGVPVDLHAWVIGTLERIGNRMGVKQAMALIPITKKHYARMKLDVSVGMDFTETDRGDYGAS